MANPNFLTANQSGIELMPGVNDQAQGYDVNRIIQALNGTNIIPVTLGPLTVVGNETVQGTITLTGGSAPATPTGLSATPYRQGVFLTWKEITPGTISPKQYEIAVSTDNFSSIFSSELNDVIVVTGPSSVPNPYVVTVGPGNSYFYPYPASGVTLYFKIRARDWAGNVSAYSSVVSTTTTSIAAGDLPSTLNGPLTVSGELTATDFKTVANGELTQSRYLGVLTHNGPPAFPYTYQSGDWVYDTNGAQWLCTSSGTPGTWTTFPLGELGYSELLTIQTAFSADTDITGLSVTVNVGVGRRIKVSAVFCSVHTVVTDSWLAYIRESGNNLQTIEWISDFTGSTPGESHPLSVILRPTAGSHTYNVSARRNSGTGTMQPTATSEAPSYILVEDIGD